MKTLIGKSLCVSMIALVFAACTATETARIASKRQMAGAGQPGYHMPPAENVHQAQGGDIVLQIQRRAPGNSQL